jgi:ketosteroid isomerase-like protein
MRFPFKVLLALTFFSFSVAGADGQFLTRDRQSSKSDSAAVEKTAQQFVEAFTNLDWERFRKFFAADATVFFPPSARFPRRANGKTEIESVFRSVFDNARKQKSSPPYLNIQPKEMKIEMLGDVAIVTFHLEDPDFLGRRTIVFQKRGGQWVIVHLHASGTQR